MTWACWAEVTRAKGQFHFGSKKIKILDPITPKWFCWNYWLKKRYWVQLTSQSSGIFFLFIAYNLWIQNGLLYGVCGNKFKPKKNIRTRPSWPLIQLKRLRGFYVSFNNPSHRAQQIVPENPLGQKTDPIGISVISKYEASGNPYLWEMAPFSPSLFWAVFILVQRNGLKPN